MSDEVTQTEWEGRFTALTAQRNEALDRCVLMQGTIAMMRERIAELEKAKD